MRRFLSLLILLLAFGAHSEPNDETALLCMVPNAPAQAFNPTQIPNVIAYWNYRDLALGPVTTWTDEVSGIQLKSWLGTATNTGFGVYFNGSAGLSNAVLDCPATFSIWAVVAYVYPNNPEGQIYGSQANNSTNLQFNNNNGAAPSPVYIDGHWSSDNEWTGNNFPLIYPSVETVSRAPLWSDIVYSEGAVLVNGQTTAGNISAPSGHVAFQAMGNSLTGGNGFTGYIKALLISTNHAITATEALSLYNWEQTNGVTNVSNGLVAWYKVNDTSGSATISDATGNGWTGTLHGSPKPTWDTGINSVVNQALTFDGSQNDVRTPITSSFLSGTTVSIAAWVKSPTAAQSSGNGWLCIHGAGTQCAVLFSDGAFSTVGAIRCGVAATSGGNWLEGGAPVFVDDGWHYIVFSTDGTAANYTMWFDGIKDLGIEYSGQAVITSGAVTTWSTSITNLEWGGIPANVALNGNFTGTHDSGSVTDVRIYNRQLTDAEVDVLYRSAEADRIIGAYSF